MQAAKQSLTVGFCLSVGEWRSRGNKKAGHTRPWGKRKDRERAGEARRAEKERFSCLPALQTPVCHPTPSRNVTH